MEAKHTKPSKAKPSHARAKPQIEEGNEVLFHKISQKDNK